MSTARRDIPFTQLPDWVITADISHATLRVYAAICMRVGKDRTAWPGIRRIADDAHVSKTTVVNAVATLEQIGAIVVTRTDTETNRYWLPLTPNALEPADDTEPGDRTTTGTGVVQPLVQGGTTTGTDGGATTGTELHTVRTTPNNKREDGDRRRNPLWDVIVEILGDPSDAQRALQGRLVAELRRNKVEPDEVRRIAQRFAAEYGPGKLTLGALAKNWARWRDSVALAHLTEDQMADWIEKQKRAARWRRLGPGTEDEGDGIR